MFISYSAYIKSCSFILKSITSPPVAHLGKNLASWGIRWMSRLSGLPQNIPHDFPPHSINTSKGSPVNYRNPSPPFLSWYRNSEDSYSRVIFFFLDMLYSPGNFFDLQKDNIVSFTSSAQLACDWSIVVALVAYYLVLRISS